VIIGAGATVLGPVTIARNSKIGSGSVVVSSVPADSTVVEIPGTVVEGQGVQRDPQARLIDLDHSRMPDAVAKAIGNLVEYIQKLERRIDELSTRREGPEQRHDENDETLRKAKDLLVNTRRET